MIVVSDTSALTSLIQIGRERILLDLFAKVIVPTAVKEELLAFHDVLPEFLIVQAVTHRFQIDRLLNEVDRGEAEAIALAEELSADLLLMDDLAGRTAPPNARSLSLDCWAF